MVDFSSCPDNSSQGNATANSSNRKLALVLGMGNPLLSDDAAGLLIVDRMSAQSSQQSGDITFKHNYCGGIDMLYDLEGFSRAVIVDAVQTGRAAPGACLRVKLKDMEILGQPRLVDSHGVNLLTVLETGRQLGYEMPGEIIIFGIEGTEFKAFSQTPTEAVLRGMTDVIVKIEQKLDQWRKEAVLSTIGVKVKKRRNNE